MDRKITEKNIEAYLKCKYKSYLYFTGVDGIISDYERHFAEAIVSFKQKAISKLLAKNIKVEIKSNVYLDRQLLQEGNQYIVNGMVVDDMISVKLDAIKQVKAPAKQSNSTYIPVHISLSEKIHREDRQQLSIYGLILAGIQGHHPLDGIIIHGQQLKTTKIRLTSNYRKTNRILEEIKDIQNNKLQPLLILNNHCQICEFQQHCLQLALAEDNLSQLNGLTEKQIVKFNNNGIFTVSQLSHTYRARRKPSSKSSHHHDFALQALALRDKRVFITEQPTLMREPVQIYFDIEGIPDRRYNYLVGALICTENMHEYRSFWADDPSQELTILDDFLYCISNYSDFHVYHYGTYDTNFLKRLHVKSKCPELIDKILSNSTNTLSLIYGRIYFPVYSNSLKHIAKILGYAWKNDKSSGINSIVWRLEWESKLSADIQERIINYNHDDCAALKLVTDFIYAISSGDKINIGEQPTSDKIQVSFIENLRPVYNHPDWCSINFATPDLDYINRCAYFNYQREKIYVQTNDNIAKQHLRSSNRHKKWIKPTKRDVVNCCSCPYCGSLKILKCREGIRRRKCLDLKITFKYVKRVVDELSTFKYRCLECHNKFYPDKYSKMMKYGHSLKSWAMYEYVAHRVSLQNLEQTFRDLFNLPVCLRHILVIKRIMANYYQETVDGIRRRLVRGSILHADETQIHLQHGKGYVWVTEMKCLRTGIKYPDNKTSSFSDVLNPFVSSQISDE